MDTGASSCLFEASFAADLGLDLTSGVLTRFRTANSSFEAYGHEIEVNVLGIAVHSLVYFFADPSIRKNVLGRGGWLDRVRMGLVDQDREIFLAPYDYEGSDKAAHHAPDLVQLPGRVLFTRRFATSRAPSLFVA